MGNYISSDEKYITENNIYTFKIIIKIYDIYIFEKMIRNNFNKLKENFNIYKKNIINNLYKHKQILPNGKQFINIDKQTVKYYIKKYYYGNNLYRKLTFGEYLFFNDRLQKNNYYLENKYIVTESYVNTQTQYLLTVTTNNNYKIINKIYKLNDNIFPETHLPPI